jgi:hypothetical protein
VAADRKLSTITDASAPHHVHPIDLLAESVVETDLPASPVGDASNPTASPPEEETKSDTPAEETPLADLQPIVEQPDGTTPENPRQERSPTLSSTSSVLTKSTLPLSHKFITELVESHIFYDSSTSNTDTSPPDVEELCARAFSDHYGMDLFLQILDEKRGRCAELEKQGFKNMKIAMKVSAAQMDWPHLLFLPHCPNRFSWTSVRSSTTSNQLSESLTCQSHSI